MGLVNIAAVNALLCQQFALFVEWSCFPLAACGGRISYSNANDRWQIIYALVRYKIIKVKERRFRVLRIAMSSALVQMLFNVGAPRQLSSTRPVFGLARISTIRYNILAAYPSAMLVNSIFLGLLIFSRTSWL